MQASTIACSVSLYAVDRNTMCSSTAALRPYAVLTVVKNVGAVTVRVGPAYARRRIQHDLVTSLDLARLSNLRTVSVCPGHPKYALRLARADHESHVHDR